eukprot:scaffold684_cov345-Pavlova_lutheri.AAC.78
MDGSPPLDEPGTDPVQNRRSSGYEREIRSLLDPKETGGGLSSDRPPGRRKDRTEDRRSFLREMTGGPSVLGNEGGRVIPTVTSSWVGTNHVKRIRMLA